MKILLTAINAKYIHSNLAIYYLKEYAKEYKDNIELAEFTINNYTDYIIQEIYKKKPDIIAFSCYIWNIDIVEEVACELHKILPNTKIWFGGPEVSYDVKERLERVSYIDGIMIGEGEETFKELLDYYIEDSMQLEEVKGIAFKNSAYKNSTYKNNGLKTNTEPIDMKHENNVINHEVTKKEEAVSETITVTPIRPQLDLSQVPFPYDNLEDFKNKIIYYESSRGCPYSCSYCLSSIDKKVRLRDTELVKKELALFIKNNIPQVKFVDRTFNCNRNHALEIWRFIKEQDNGKINFHFEISADILSDEEITLLNSMRPGLVQLEIGVQSTNEDTIKAINRKMDFNKLSAIVNRIKAGHNVHQHLDLIAGLPYEDYPTFTRSFNDVYSLKPDQFQLGFLKVLKGSKMYEYSKNHSIIYKDHAPYEVLFTKWLSYDDVLQLKEVEEMVEVYYNSGQFTYSVNFLEHFFPTPFELYQSLGDYYERNHLFDTNHTRMNRYYILLEFYKEKIQKDSTAFEEILIYDLYLRENLKTRPDFAKDNTVFKSYYRNFYQNEERIKTYLKNYSDYNSKQISRITHFESVSIDILETVQSGSIVPKKQFILFDYKNRNPLNYEAKTFFFDEEFMKEQTENN